MSNSILILVGTSRDGRRSLDVAHVVRQELERREALRIDWFDLGENEFPIMRQRLNEMAQPPANLLEFEAKVNRADGLLLVVPEYKNGYPGSLKNALDYLPPGVFRHKPVAIITVSSGGFGGINCLAQLRLVCLALGGLPIPDALPVSRVNSLFDEQGGVSDDQFTDKLAVFCDALSWYTAALVEQRRATNP